MTPDGLIVTETYGQWVTISGMAMRDAGADLGRITTEHLVDRLDRYLTGNFLKRVANFEVRISDSQDRAMISDEVAVIAETRANGLPPERRLPQGRWAWLRMP